MRIRALAWNTFSALLRNKLIVLLTAGFLCIVLFMMSPLRYMKSAAGGPGMVLGRISAIMSLVSGFGNLLAAWRRRTRLHPK